MTQPTPAAGQAVLDGLADLALTVERDLPRTRERSMVLTKLDEARLWAGEAQALAADLADADREAAAAAARQDQPA